jgi:predicted nucleic acid-binding protein
MLYIDTSVLVASLTNEAETARMQTWLAAQTPDTLAISLWVATEFSSALSVKVRTGDIDPIHHADALEAFRLISDESFAMWSVSAVDFRMAASFADQSQLGIRAGDALHLAICTRNRATLCTLDRRLSEAGTALGLKTVPL